MKTMTPLRGRMRWPIDMLPDDELALRWPTRLSRLLTDFDDGLQTVSDWKPAIDVQETDTEYRVKVDLPGVEAKDIEVAMDRGALTIAGERKSEKRDEKNGFNCVERFEGSFFRRLHLRDAADDADVSAVAKQGVVEIRVPKAGGSRPRKVEVKES